MYLAKRLKEVSFITGSPYITSANNAPRAVRGSMGSALRLGNSVSARALVNASLNNCHLSCRANSIMVVASSFSQPVRHEGCRFMCYI